MTKATSAKSTKKTTMTSAATTADESTRGRKIDVVGVVISDKMDKTISVQIFRTIRHPKYGKYMKRSSVFKAHDEKDQAKMGDKVRIRETRPLSKTKRWSLVEIVEAAKN